MSRVLSVLLGAVLLATTLAAKNDGESTYDPSKSRAANQMAFEVFNRRYGDRWLVVWNPITGTPHSITGYFTELPAPLTKDNVESETRLLLLSLQHVLQIEPARLVLAKADFDEPRNQKTAGAWYVYYKQTFGAARVDGGSVRVIVRGTKVTELASDFYPEIAVAPEPAVPLESAVAAIGRAEGGKQLKPVSSELIVHTIVNNGILHYRLAWAVVIPPIPRPKEAAVQWRYVVDAHNGHILDRQNLLESEDVSGRVTGDVVPRYPTDTPVERPMPSLTVTARQGASTFQGDTDSDGRYRITGLAAGPADIEAFLSGPHIQVLNDETPDPDAHHNATVVAPGVHDWNWATDDPSPLAAESNGFFHVSAIRDYFLRGDPFDLAVSPEPVVVHVRSTFPPPCNALAGSGEIFFGLPDGSCTEPARCPSIGYHEYTHNMVHVAYARAGVETFGLRLFQSMNEAWADYFSATNLDDPILGNFCVATPRNIDTPDRRYPEDLTGEPHEDGRVFSGALWDLRRDLGPAYVDSLAVRGLKHAVADFSEYLAAVIAEDDDPAFSTDPAGANNIPADGSPNIDTICHEYFDGHGIFHPYCAGHVTNPVAIITSPDPHPLSFIILPASEAAIVVIGSASGEAADPLDNYVIEYAHHSTPATWLNIGVSLTSGGRSAVAGGELGRIASAGLLNGRYQLRLTVRTAGGRVATATTVIWVDHELRAGWPQLPDLRFIAPVAVADIDPAFPGLEIASGFGFVWHADGSLAPGWPVFGGNGNAPAIGDLDGDGSLELVLTSSSTVSIFRNNGDPMLGDWPKSVTGQIHGNAVLADLDGDGDLEILVLASGTPNSSLYAWHYDGSVVAGNWPLTIAEPTESVPGVADIDGDGLPEVAAGSSAGHMFVWDSAGRPRWTATAAGSPPLLGTPSFADVDGDGRMEIFVSSGKSIGSTIVGPTQVYAWHEDGTELTGWPQPLTHILQYPGGPLFADLDHDGRPEVVAMSNDERIHVWNASGTLLPRWPSPPVFSSSFNTLISQPAAADVDGDGDIDIVASMPRLFEQITPVVALHRDGSMAAGWPKFLRSGVATPVVADIDFDGRPEVIAGGFGTYVWNLPATFAAASAEWATYRHDNQRTGAYDPRPQVSLLFDISASMGDRPEGGGTTDPAQQKITFARQAAIPFLELLNDFAALRAEFGIVAFPAPSSPFDCDSAVITPISTVNAANITVARTTAIPSLTPAGFTPLLNGVDRARSTLRPGTRSAIVLLSDGAQNCPREATVGDPEVSALIDRLTRQSTRVFAIGFGAPLDIDPPLLEALASRTTPRGFAGSQFYDVTTPSFDPATWDPATALQATYKSVLIDALGLEGVVDPLDTIAGGRRKSFDVAINEHDRLASFYLSWKTLSVDRLQMTIRSSDDEVVPFTGSGLRFHQGATYAILTVGREFLSRPGKVGPRPWTFEVSAEKIGPNQNERFQYSIIVDSALQMRAGFDRTSSVTGQPLLLTVDLRERGQHLTTGKAQVIVNTPSSRTTKTLPMFDNATHGDAVANDGIYSTTFDDTGASGMYAFRFHAEGKTTAGRNFTRERVAQRFIRLRSPSDNPP